MTHTAHRRSKMATSIVLLICLGQLWLTGCTPLVGEVAVEKYNRHPLTVAIPAHLSPQEVEDGIIQTLRARQWAMVHQSPQEVVAMLAQRDFHAMATLQVEGDRLKILNDSYFKEDGGKVFVPGVPKERLRELQRNLTKRFHAVAKSAGNRPSVRPPSTAQVDTPRPPSPASGASQSFQWLAFATPPQTLDEFAVARVIEARMAAYNQKNIAGIMQHIAPEARIHSRRAGDVVSREQFRQALASTLADLGHVVLQQVRMETISPAHIRVHMMLVADYQGKRSPSQVQSAYLRRDGRWLMIRSLFVE